MAAQAPAIAHIGLGPRGISTLERLIAQLGTITGTPQQPEKLTLHLIDDAQHGGGNIWDINQPKHLCMNTFAHGMTLFPEPGATVSAPIVEGPTIYEWIRLHVGDRTGIKPEKLAYVDAHPLEPDVTAAFPVEELQAFRPESYLPRALYGHYLLWFFHSILRDVPDWVEVIEHHARATNLVDKGDYDLITLSDGHTIQATATLSITGWYDQGYSGQEQWITQQLEQHPGLKWLRAGNPIQQGIEKIADNENVLARGLGMGFFDVLILSTQGRGGRFIEDKTKPWGLRYEATGTEPHFFAASRRGYPFLPQSDDRGLPPKAHLPRLGKVVEELAQRTGPRSIDYDTEVWPAVAKDSYQAYVDTLARVEPAALRSPREDIIAAIDAAKVDAAAVFNGIAALDQVIEDHTTKRFSLLRWIHLIPAAFDNAAELHAYLVQRVTEDLQEAELGPDSPVRAALWALGFARKPQQLLGAEGRYTIESRHHMFDKAINLGQMTCSGPPLFRTRQLLALADAGVVTFVGGHPLLGTTLEGDAWTMSSQSSANHRFKGTTLLDAWVHKTDIRRASVDEFAGNLIDSGRLTPFTETTADGTVLATGSPHLDPVTRQALRRDAHTVSPTERLHVVGVPAHAQYPDTTLSPPLPGTDSWFIQETDKAAISALQVALS